MNTYFKELGYTSINYTSKINTINKYFEMIHKANQPLFEKYIYYININKIKSKDLREQIKQMINCHLDEDDIIVFFNKDNFVFYKNNITIPRNKINEFLEIQSGQLYKCLVCLKEDFTTINNCHQCSASYCTECIIKSIKNPIPTNKIPIQCLLCKYTNGYLVIE